ncbi:hypothetical protein BHM03_00055812 [Ensete ventricosum]|nr:hypothetical protein BHM03_00055812 [Ensete ventricosum]
MAITSTHDSKYALAMWESSTYLQPATLLLTRAVHAMDMLTLDRHRRTVRSPLPAPYVEATRPTLVPSFSWNTVPADPPQLCPFRWSRPRGVPAGSIDLRSMAAMRGMWIEAYLCVLLHCGQQGGGGRQPRFVRGVCCHDHCHPKRKLHAFPIFAFQMCMPVIGWVVQGRVVLDMQLYTYCMHAQF